MKAFAKASPGWVAAIAVVAITTLLLVFALKLPTSRLDVPYTFHGDAVEKLAQVDTVAETGWLFHNPRLGYPFGYDRLDFPRFDSLNHAVMGPVAALTGEPGLAMNLYFLASFYLIALSALLVFRRLRLSTGVAVVCALAYAFLPYHVLRGVSHLTNGAYFLVPPAILAATWVAQGRLDAGTPGVRGRWWIAAATAVLLPLQMPYNGVFFSFLCAIAGMLAFARSPRLRAAAPAAVLVAATALAFVVEQTPSLAHRAGEGANPSVAARGAGEAELLSLRLNQVLLPTSHHRIGALAEAKRGFDQAMGLPRAEFRDQYVGLLGALGFCALLWAIAQMFAARPAASPLEHHVRTAALFALGILLLAMSGGVFTLLAYWLTSKIRATNRILPFLAFLCLLGGGWLLQGLLAKIRPFAARSAVLMLVAALVLFDLTAPARLGDRQALVSSYDAARAYFETVEDRLGAGAAVFQLPAVWYPEHPPVNGRIDYEDFKPYLFTKTLRFSYGSSHGRQGYAWASTVAELPAADIVRRAHAIGFDAILVDSAAYEPQRLASLVDGLARALPTEPIDSADARWRLFPLRGCCGPVDAASIRTTIESARDYTPDGTPLRFAAGGTGGFHRAGGWGRPEADGLWSTGAWSVLRMRLRGHDRAQPLVLDMDASVLLGPRVPARRLTVEANGRRIGDVGFALGTPAPVLRFVVPPLAVGADDMLTLRFRVTPATSPLAAGVNEDGRMLGVQLRTLSLRPDATH